MWFGASLPPEPQHRNGSGQQPPERRADARDYDAGCRDEKREDSRKPVRHVFDGGNDCPDQRRHQRETGDSLDEHRWGGRNERGRNAREQAENDVGDASGNRRDPSFFAVRRCFGAGGECLGERREIDSYPAEDRAGGLYLPDLYTRDSERTGAL